jgi:hypothetical protein
MSMTAADQKPHLVARQPARLGRMGRGLCHMPVDERRVSLLHG